MAEGLDPIDTGRELHERIKELHGEPDKDLGSGAAAGKDHAHDRHSRRVQIFEALLLALVTMTAAWAGYAAAAWGTVSRVDIARANTLRDLATRADLEALSIRNFDSASFDAWFTAFTLNSPQKESVAERRFRPQFLVAFKAWLATDPLHNSHAPPGPTYMPQYKIAEQTTANSLDTASDAKFQVGTHDGLISDDYIRITVFLAAVLFLVGIGSTFKLYNVRYALITFGSALLIVATVLILLQPGLPD
ncbi:MAG TPA: hypothetical protein VLW50_30675 [Streptosporangiaceae bacterium]|nr:hypothetical protein [Streptosporangiaceae bacterium]